MLEKKLLKLAFEQIKIPQNTTPMTMYILFIFSHYLYKMVELVVQIDPMLTPPTSIVCFFVKMSGNGTGGGISGNGR